MRNPEYARADGEDPHQSPPAPFLSSSVPVAVLSSKAPRARKTPVAVPELESPSSPPKSNDVCSEDMKSPFGDLRERDVKTSVGGKRGTVSEGRRGVAVWERRVRVAGKSGWILRRRRIDQICLASPD